MRQFFTKGMLCLALFVGLASTVSAASIFETLPEFNGVGVGSGFPLSPVTVGTFNYIIPAGEIILSAVISGTFGNSSADNSAGVDVKLDGLLVGQCIQNNSCFFSGPLVPWSHTFAPSEFPLLSDGVAVLTAVQTSSFFIRLGQTTLQISTAPIPEPSTMLLLGTGLAGLVAWRMRKGRA